MRFLPSIIQYNNTGIVGLKESLRPDWADRHCSDIQLKVILHLSRLGELLKVLRDKDQWKLCQRAFNELRSIIGTVFLTNEARSWVYLKVGHITDTICFYFIDFFFTVHPTSSNA